MSISGNVYISSAVSSALDTPENRSGLMYDSIQQAYPFTDGVGAGQNDLVWSDRRTVVAGATDTIDLNGGGLTDVFGVAVNFVEVTSITIRNRETAGAAGRTLRFGPAEANTFLWVFVDPTDLIAIAPAGCYCQFIDAGVACPAGSDTIRIINTDGANQVGYDILVIGRSA